MIQRLVKIVQLLKRYTGASRITLLLCALCALCGLPAKAQWFVGPLTVSNVTTLPMQKGFAIQTFPAYPQSSAETIMVTNVNTNDTLYFWYWTQQYGQGVAPAPNNGAPNSFPLVSISTNFNAATLASLGLTNGSGIPTNGGTVYVAVPQTVFTVSNVLYGSFSNSAWASGGTGRTNGIQSSP